MRPVAPDAAGAHNGRLLRGISGIMVSGARAGMNGWLEREVCVYSVGCTVCGRALWYCALCCMG